VTTPPVLHPGDSIHLAFPVSPVLYGRERDEYVAGQNRQWIDFYASFGVTVAAVSWNSQLAAPVVVAVFRKPPAENAERLPAPGSDGGER
jgi:hypothetical protein